MDYRRLVESLKRLYSERPCIVQVVGPRDSGKTALITLVIRLLRERRRDLRILVIKHSHHRSIDVEDKDSFRYIEAGADMSLVGVSTGYAVFSSSIDPLEIVRPELFHIVFIEGFREEEIGHRIVLGGGEDLGEVAGVVARYLEERGCLGEVSVAPGRG